MSDNRHVYREHVTAGRDCWCGPRYELPCDECDDGCWKCEGGVIHLDREAAMREERPIAVIHQHFLKEDGPLPLSPSSPPHDSR